ncbi:MAG TPA: helix-turn-helix transcriptional regulator [Pseudonocardiaceae bacterium]|jgi:transcriptional regulator with XRE-family HTH domain|nr:helix-turn-helix transcriptional regulator [Pseudonocardiaceae bacterium]
MGTSEQRRAELGTFLRARRSQLDRAAVGLPQAGRRRITGLRREEVATLSAVSVTWYTWLEQGRDVNPSRQVLDALATTLRLSNTEHGYLLSLAGYTAAAATPRPAPQAPAHVQRLMDHLHGMPAYAITHDWSICGWNQAYQALYPNVASVAAQDRNLLWLVFTDPFVRRLLPDWEITSRHFLAEFRAEAGTRLGDPDCATLIQRLNTRSSEFAAGWSAHSVEGFASRRRAFLTPAGQLTFEHHRLAPADCKDIHLVIYMPADADTAQRLIRLQECHHNVQERGPIVRSYARRRLGPAGPDRSPSAGP